MTRNRLELCALPGLPLVEPGDDLVALLMTGLQAADWVLADGDVVVVAQKIVSKAENRYAWLSEVEPSARAQELAAQTDKDPRLVELMLQESRAVLRHRPGAIIVEHRLGYVHANAGIDRSNIPSDDEVSPRVLLLPEDPDGSAAALRAGLMEQTGVQVAVIINDSAGRAWRNGTVGFALGTAGFEPVENRIGQPDLFGRPLEVTEVAVADELAAAASFLMGQADEGAPVVVVRGAALPQAECGSRSLIRDPVHDMFR